jgi:putative transposase
MPFYRKRLRLPSNHYRGFGVYFVTIATEKRTPYFDNPSTGQWLLNHLLQTAARQQFSMHAYCVMPDHVHFLCQGLSDSSDLVTFVEAFKQRTGYEFRAKHRSRLWQMRYYDHVLRPKEKIEDAACYIWWNPARKGLCREPHQYPLSGSNTIDWIKSSAARAAWLPPWKSSAPSDPSL